MSYTKKGILISLTAIVLLSLSNVCMRYFITAYHVQPAIFVCANAFTCALILILFAGPGTGGIKTVLSFHTWGYGMFQILTNIGMSFAFVYITSTETKLMSSIEIIFSFVLAYIFLKRKPNLYDIFGMVITLIAFALVAINLDAAVRFDAILWVIVGSLAVTFRTIIAETHPQNIKEQSVKDRCRVTGYIMIITTISFILFFAVLAQFENSLDFNNPLLKLVPHKQDFFHTASIVCGVILGTLVYPATMYFYFMAAKFANTETFAMMRSIQPMVTYGIEFVFALVTVLSVSAISNIDIAAAITIILASIMMIINKVKIKNTQK